MTEAAAPVVLRPRGTAVLCIVVWAVLAGMAIEALLAAGLWGLRVYPGIALIGTVLWALLWAPRLVVGADGLVIHNVLHTYRLPFARITDVRLGAMVHVEVDDLKGRPRRVTAWNAPGIGRDRPWGRAAAPVRDHRPGRDPGAAGGTPERRRQLSRGERMARDQAASRSALARSRWDSWHTRHPRGADVPAVRTLNLPQIGAVLGALALTVLVTAAL